MNAFYYDENLPTVGGEKANVEQNESNENVNKEKDQKKNYQSKERIYPDIYECGPASQTGPILKVINRKAYQFFKYIEA